jgi:hypothetical protein
MVRVENMGDNKTNKLCNYMGDIEYLIIVCEGE